MHQNKESISEGHTPHDAFQKSETLIPVFGTLEATYMYLLTG